MALFVDRFVVSFVLLVVVVSFVPLVWHVVVLMGEIQSPNGIVCVDPCFIGLQRSRSTRSEIGE